MSETKAGMKVGEKVPYTVSGYDAFGWPLTENITVEYRPRTWGQSIKYFLGRWVFRGWLHNVGYRLGIHAWRRITSITVRQ